MCKSMHSVSIALAALAVVFFVFAFYVYSVKDKLDPNDNSFTGQHFAKIGLFVLAGLGLLAAFGTYMSARSPPDPLAQVDAAI